MYSTLLSGLGERNAHSNDYLEKLKALVSPIQDPETNTRAMLEAVTGGCWVKTFCHVHVASASRRSDDFDDWCPTKTVAEPITQLEPGESEQEAKRKPFSTFSLLQDLSSVTGGGKNAARFCPEGITRSRDNQLHRKSDVEKLRLSTNDITKSSELRAIAGRLSAKQCVRENNALREEATGGVYPQALHTPIPFSSACTSTDALSITASSDLLGPSLVPKFFQFEGERDGESVNGPSSPSSACSLEATEIIEAQYCNDDSRKVESKIKRFWQKLQSGKGKR